ncbi:hypothetical protein [Alkalithermobacter thermoalcaliphilus]|uniref:hypothetical protein n=1 Tax=Clostridium paradoxum TaxID=29346 RepID=UPI00128EBC16
MCPYLYTNITISFPYHPKTIRFYKQIDQEELCTTILNIKNNSVLSMLERTLDKNWLKGFEEKRNLIHPKLMKKALLNKNYMKEFLKL